MQRIEHIEGYAEKQFIKYFVSVQKNFIDKTKPEMAQMRAKLQDSVGVRDRLADKEQFYSRE